MKTIPIIGISPNNYSNLPYYYVNNGNDVMVSIGVFPITYPAGPAQIEIFPFVTYDNFLWLALDSPNTPLIIPVGMAQQTGISIANGLYGVRGIQLQVVGDANTRVGMIVCESFVPIRTSAIGNAPTY